MLDAITWYKASDGTAATAMDVAIVSQWIKVGVRNRIAFQNVWVGAGGGKTAPTGSFVVQFTNTALPSYNSTPCDFPAAGFGGTPPTQPAGAAGDNLICVDTIGLWVRQKYTPSADGTCAPPTGNALYERVKE